MPATLPRRPSRRAGPRARARRGPARRRRRCAPGSGDPAAEAAALRTAIAARDRSARRVSSAGDRRGGAEILAFQVAMLEDDALADRAFAEIAAGAAGGPRLARGAGRGDRRLRGGRGRVFPRPRRRSRGHPRPGARRTRRRGRRARSRRAPSSSREDLTPSRFLAIDWTRRRHRARGRQPDEPCRHAGARRAACRWWSASRRPHALRPSRREALVDGDDGPRPRSARRGGPRRVRDSRETAAADAAAQSMPLPPEAGGDRRRHADRRA